MSFHVTCLSFALFLRGITAANLQLLADMPTAEQAAQQEQASALAQRIKVTATLLKNLVITCPVCKKQRHQCAATNPPACRLAAANFVCFGCDTVGTVHKGQFAGPKCSLEKLVDGVKLKCCFHCFLPVEHQFAVDSLVAAVAPGSTTAYVHSNFCVYRHSKKEVVRSLLNIVLPFARHCGVLGIGQNNLEFYQLVQSDNVPLLKSLQLFCLVEHALRTVDFTKFGHGKYPVTTQMSGLLLKSNEVSHDCFPLRTIASIRRSSHSVRQHIS